MQSIVFDIKPTPQSSSDVFRGVIGGMLLHVITLKANRREICLIVQTGALACFYAVVISIDISRVLRGGRGLSTEVGLVLKYTADVSHHCYQVGFGLEMSSFDS